MLLSLQIRLGTQSISDAFTHWKECTVWLNRVQHLRDLSKEVENQVASETHTQGELQGRLGALEGELKRQMKEMERN